MMSFPFLSPAASGSEDDEEEIASPPFEPLNTTHSSPLPGDAISSLISYLEDFRLSADNRRIQDEEQRCQRDEERTYVTTRQEKRRRIHGSKFLSHFCLLCTDRSLRQRAGHSFTSTPLMPVPVGAVPTVRHSRDNRRPTRRFSCGCHAHRRDFQQAGMWPTVPGVAGRLFLPSFPAVASSVGRLLYHAGFTEAATTKQLIQLRMAVSLDVQRILEHTLGIALTLP
ncbi:hypothetical protein GWK47_042188 [Chionoecetes opilio]|uniref:Uncharacterized protein n=1 Tax=Chionoecetes opilio TaxID=41210 RepID=A0A8J5D076_CHIOP|nr:hypothetical protein GWK47_042188 [Chionoecetes opilio]